MTFEKELQIGIDACLKAATLCEKIRLGIPESIEKNDRSPVTLADFGSQAIICHRIRREFPDDPIVAEENPKELLKPERIESLRQIVQYVHEVDAEADEKKIIEWIGYGNGRVAPRYWTLDPIDGTKGFLRRDQYAIALALVIDGQVQLGILACPALDNAGGVLFYAVRGQGAYSQSIRDYAHSSPSRIFTVTPDQIEQSCFAESFESAHSDQSKQNEIARQIGIRNPPIRMDSQVKYGLVASGRAALYLRLPNPHHLDYRENIWDHAAGSIVVEEAGGKVTDMFGQPLNFRDGEKMLENRGVIVSNGSLHQKVIDILKE